ncbi:hypothetical protein VTI74DRAFT_4274 [Chaetomium olivicolor]
MCIQCGSTQILTSTGLPFREALGPRTAWHINRLFVEIKIVSFRGSSASTRSHNPPSAPALNGGRHHGTCASERQNKLARRSQCILDLGVTHRRANQIYTANQPPGKAARLSSCRCRAHHRWNVMACSEDAGGAPRRTHAGPGVAILRNALSFPTGAMPISRMHPSFPFIYRHLPPASNIVPRLG